MGLIDKPRHEIGWDIRRLKGVENAEAGEINPQAGNGVLAMQSGQDEIADELVEMIPCESEVLRCFDVDQGGVDDQIGICTPDEVGRSAKIGVEDADVGSDKGLGGDQGDELAQVSDVLVVDLADIIGDLALAVDAVDLGQSQGIGDEVVGDLAGREVGVVVVAGMFEGGLEGREKVAFDQFGGEKRSLECQFCDPGGSDGVGVEAFEVKA